MGNGKWEMGNGEEANPLDSCGIESQVHPFSTACSPHSPRRAAVGMSGGVDSSVAAALLREEGYECIGLTLKLFAGGSRCCSLQDINDAREVARRLRIPHYTLNFTDHFTRDVIRPFIETYEAGATPNPCIACNRFIKFEKLLLRVRQLDYDFLATGHYARIERQGDRLLLLKARDHRKDQSYFLYSLRQDHLERAIFPLGDKTKEKVRAIAASRGFANAAKEDSQDICFVTEGDYGTFMETWTGKQYPPGDMVDEAGTILGRHRGLIRYTLGQRRGLGVSQNRRLYVTGKSLEKNQLVLGPEERLYSKVLAARPINLIALPSLERPRRVKVKTRYLQEEEWAVAEQTGPEELRIEFDHPQRALTPGQAAVLYEGEVVLGGGTIV